MQGFLSSYASIWKPARGMTTTPPAALSNVEEALVSALGPDAVSTAPERLDAYVADTYWPALDAAAAGRRSRDPTWSCGRRPRSRSRRSCGSPTPSRAGGPLGRRLRHPGRLPACARRHRNRPHGARRDHRDRRRVDDGHRAGGRQRPPARSRAERARPDAAALPGLGRVGDGRRLHRGARLRCPLDALREDRGPAALAAGRDPGGRPDGDRRGPAPRGRAGAHAAVRRLGGHARGDHARHAAARADPGRAPLRSGRVPHRRRRDRRGPRRAPARLPPIGRADVRRRRDAARVRPGGRRGAHRRLHGVRVRGRRGGGAARGAPHGRARPGGRRRGARSRRSASAGGTGATTSTTRPTTRSSRRSGARSTSSRPTTGSAPSTTRCTPRCACRTPTPASS